MSDEVKEPSQQEWVSESGWLIEHKQFRTWYDGRGPETFTSNPDDVLRFARREDAERALHWLVKESLRDECFVSGHEWCGLAADASPESQKEKITPTFEDALNLWLDSQRECVNCGHTDTHSYFTTTPDRYDGHVDSGYLCSFPHCGCTEPDYPSPNEGEIFKAGYDAAKKGMQ